MDDQTRRGGREIKDGTNRDSSEESAASNRGDENASRAGRQPTRGTNRDFDESGTSRNQGHGHPREERGHRG